MNIRYVKNKMILIRLLATVSLPPDLSTSEREQQETYGYLPNQFNVHHILSKSCEGSDNINNLAVILKTKHSDLNIYLNYIDKTHKKFTEKDRPFLERLTKEYGGYTLEDVQRLTIN